MTKGRRGMLEPIPEVGDTLNGGQLIAGHEETDNHASDKIQVTEISTSAPENKWKVFTEICCLAQVCTAACINSKPKSSC
ncbi:uncharacterized protein LOC144089159 isoform X2 [Stigmatopora argus]